MKQSVLPLFILACTSLLVPRELAALPSQSPAAARQDRFGVFAVLSTHRARLVGVTDGNSPADFLAMIEAHPGIRSLELLDCPGTRDDIANLRLGRMIRQHGISTIAPAGASVRSGAVDIFLAGASRMAASDARFSVHSWLSQDGRQANVMSAKDPARTAYERYYRDMGLSDGAAQAFYSLTVSVPNNRTLDLAPRDLERFAKLTITT